MEMVYALSAKGQYECVAAHPTLNDELGRLLRLVDGRRTRDDLLATVGKNAITTGGLRWLAASGYIYPTQPPHSSGLVPRSQPPAEPALSRPATVSTQAMQFGSSARSSAPVALGGPDNVGAVLAEYMLRSIGRHLGTGGIAYRREIARATSVDALLPWLNPLLEAILVQSGNQAAAEFGDTAAFILQSLPATKERTIKGLRKQTPLKGIVPEQL